MSDLKYINRADNTIVLTIKRKNAVKYFLDRPY